MSFSRQFSTVNKNLGPVFLVRFESFQSAASLLLHWLFPFPQRDHASDQCCSAFIWVEKMRIKAPINPIFLYFIVVIMIMRMILLLLIFTAGGVEEICQYWRCVCGERLPSYHLQCWSSCFGLTWCDRHPRPVRLVGWKRSGSDGSQRRIKTEARRKLLLLARRIDRSFFFNAQSTAKVISERLDERRKLLLARRIDRFKK